MVSSIKESIRPIPKYEGYYITEYGKVYSNKSGKMREMSVEYIESSSGLNFKSVRLYKNGYQRRFLIHILVNKIYNNSEKQCMHKDGNCFNNHYSNLVDRTDNYKLSQGEEWVEGFENRYFIYKGNVYSVFKRDYPYKLKPSSYFTKKKYSLVRSDGKVVSYYL